MTISIWGLWMAAMAASAWFVILAFVKVVFDAKRPFSPLETVVDIFLFTTLVHLWANLGWIK